jgi:hypothetical protein
VRQKEVTDVVIGAGAIYIPAERSHSGKSEAWLDHGIFSESEWHSILCRRMNRRNPPLYEVHHFEGGVEFILPDDQRNARDNGTGEKFLNDFSYELYNAERVVILS